MTEFSMSKHEETPTVFAYERHFTFDSGTQLRNKIEYYKVLIFTGGIANEFFGN